MRRGKHWRVYFGLDRASVLQGMGHPSRTRHILKNFCAAQNYRSHQLPFRDGQETMHFNPYRDHPSYRLVHDQCFIVMPYGEKWSAIIRDDIKNICEAQGLSPVRGDERRGENILDDIWQDMNESRAIIVDVTDNNPNVMYELGLAHALKKDVILIAQSVNDIPFDLKVFRHILYTTDDAGRATLKWKLTECLTDLFFRDNFGKLIDPADFVLLFLSNGGTCRCAMSNIITRYLLAPKKTQEDVERGPVGIKPLSTALYAPSLPMMSDYAQKVVSGRLGIDGKRHNTLQATPQLLRRANFILPMAAELSKTIQFNYGDKILIFTAFFGQSGDIIDPWGKTEQDYMSCFDRLYSILSANIAQLDLEQLWQRADRQKIQGPA